MDPHHRRTLGQPRHRARTRHDSPPLTADESGGNDHARRSNLLRAYLRDVGSHEVLTRREEAALAKALKRHTEVLHESLLAIPFTSRFLVERWNELRRANRVTASLAARSTAHRDPGAGARIDRTLSQVELLLGRRASKPPGHRPRERALLDRRIQGLLRRADLSPAILDEALQALRQRYAIVSETSRSPVEEQARSDVAREVGLPLPAFSERMRELEAHAQAVLELRNRFVTHNLKLVVKIAKEFSGMGLPLIDLIQEGNMILLHAVSKFDHRRGVKFSTYGSWWIRQACIRAIQNQARTVRLPSNVHDRMVRLDRLDTKLSSELNRVPEPSELGEALGVTEDHVETLRLIRQSPIPLETPIPGLDGRTIEDAIPDPTQPDPAQAMDRTRIAREIDDLVPDLPNREQRVIRWRFGLDGERPRTLAEVGRLLNLSRERVRQIEASAITQLRRQLEDRNLLQPTDWEPAHSPG